MHSMRFERGQNVRKVLRLGIEANAVMVTRISNYGFGQSSFGKSIILEIMNDLKNPKYADFHMFYRTQDQDDYPEIPQDYEMTTQIKYLPNTKEDIYMLYEGRYYEVPRP